MKQLIQWIPLALLAVASSGVAQDLGAWGGYQIPGPGGVSGMNVDISAAARAYQSGRSAAAQSGGMFPQFKFPQVSFPKVVLPQITPGGEVSPSSGQGQMVPSVPAISYPLGMPPTATPGNPRAEAPEPPRPTSPPASAPATVTTSAPKPVAPKPLDLKALQERTALLKAAALTSALSEIFHKSETITLAELREIDRAMLRYARDHRGRVGALSRAISEFLRTTKEAEGIDLVRQLPVLERGATARKRAVLESIALGVEVEAKHEIEPKVFSSIPRVKILLVRLRSRVSAR